MDCRFNLLFTYFVLTCSQAYFMNGIVSPYPMALFCYCDSFSHLNSAKKYLMTRDKASHASDLGTVEKREHTLFSGEGRTYGRGDHEL